VKIIDKIFFTVKYSILGSYPVDNGK
jgi:hypothetical protein